MSCLIAWQDIKPEREWSYVTSAHVQKEEDQRVSKAEASEPGPIEFRPSDAGP